MRSLLKTLINLLTTGKFPNLLKNRFTKPLNSTSSEKQIISLKRWKEIVVFLNLLKLLNCFHMTPSNIIKSIIIICI
uniref:Uncharacterized protein n=1 Tax=Rhizophora mucronata TaxID=61149 RepID=A0A2P2Q799_RHIMU